MFQHWLTERKRDGKSLREKKKQTFLIDKMKQRNLEKPSKV